MRIRISKITIDLKIYRVNMVDYSIILKKSGILRSDAKLHIFPLKVGWIRLHLN
jgi:hypothetical protein